MLKNIVKIISLALYTSSILNNIHSAVSTRAADPVDWQAVVDLAENMHVELMKEYLQQLSSLAYRWTHYKYKLEIFEEKSLELVVCCDNNQQIVGYFMFKVQDNYAYLDSFAYNYNEIGGQQFTKILIQYFTNNHPLVKKVFASWEVASSGKCFYTTVRRFESAVYQNHWKNFGFVATDNPLATLHASFYGSTFVRALGFDNGQRAHLQGYVLDLHPPEFT